MVYLRKAVQSDMDLLFEWANDPAVRKNSFRSDPIPYADHVKWFNHIMGDENVLQFILMDEDNPIGQIRLNLDNEEAEIGYSISADYRGKGYGHKTLQLIMRKIQADYPQIKKLVAKVKPENMASKRLFESEGYEMKYSCYSLDTMCEGYYGLSEINDSNAILNVDIYERGIAR